MQTFRRILIAGMGVFTALFANAQSGDLKHPDWHPDGRMLVSEGSCDGDVGLYLIDTDSAEVTLLFDSKNTDGYPRWFADGKRVAFHQISKKRESQIYVGEISNDGLMSDVQAVTDGPFDIEPAPSPDGRQLLYSVRGRRGQDIALQNLAGKGRKVWETDLAENFPSWHPDGQSIFFHATEEEQTHIFQRLLSTYQLNQITRGGTPNLVAHVSPAGGRVVFSSERSGDREIYIRNLDSGNDIRLTRREGRDGYPKFSPDGDRIAYHSKIEGGETVVIVLDLESGQARQFGCSSGVGPQ
jgi:TolB protein